MNNIFFKNFFILVLASFFFININMNNAVAAENSAKKDIAVKDYTWKSSGRGREGILKDITLKNLSLTEYNSIEVEIDLYSRTGTPLGSLRATLQDKLPAGSEKTYYNVNFGIMSADLEDSTAKVVSAKEEGEGPISLIGRSILVKDVKFSKAQYGTEGFIKSITLQNTTNQDFKNVIIKISDLGVSGAKAGYEGYVTKATINKVLPANSTVTIKEINIGFTHPDSKEKYVVVSDATPVSKKELKYLYSDQKDSIEIEGSKVDLEQERKLSLVERYRQKLRSENIKINSAEDSSDTESDSDIKFSIEEKVEEQKRVAKEEKSPTQNDPVKEKEPVTAKSENTLKDSPEFENTDTSSKNSQLADNTESPSSEQPVQNDSKIDNQKKKFQPQDEKAAPDPKTPAKQEAETPEIEIAELNTDISTADTQNENEEDFQTQSSEKESSDGNLNTASASRSTGSSDSGNSGNVNTEISDNSDSGSRGTQSGDISFDEELIQQEDTVPVRNYDVAFGGDEVPLPKRDILVKSFSWGSGVPGTLGKLRKLTLENISTITYTDIDILVEYYSPQGVPLGSSQFILKDDILKPDETKDFRNIDVGLVQLIPDQSNIRITVRTAKDIY